MDITDKIRKIEELIASTAHTGERSAAEYAKQRLLEKLTAQPVEYFVPASSPWKKKLFVALCQKHGLQTYRYKRQKYTTTMVRVSKPFMNEILAPEYAKYSKMFDDLAREIMEDLTAKIHRVREDDEVVIAGELPPAAEAEQFV